MSRLLDAHPRHLDDWVLIYDGDCAFCRRCVDLVSRWDRAGRIRTVPYQDERALEALPPMSRQELAAAMHLVAPDRSVRAGAAALPPLLGQLPGGGLLAALFTIPGVPWLAARIYRIVARNRHHLVACEHEEPR